VQTSYPEMSCEVFVEKDWNSLYGSWVTWNGRRALQLKGGYDSYHTLTLVRGNGSLDYVATEVNGMKTNVILASYIIPYF